MPDPNKQDQETQEQKKVTKLNKIVNEIYDTEDTFLKGIGDLEKAANAIKKNIFAKKGSRKLYKDINKITDIINQVKDEKGLNCGNGMRDVITTSENGYNIDLAKMHKYLALISKACELSEKILINPVNGANFAADAKAAVKKGKLDKLTSSTHDQLLILPAQRMPRYKLLFDDAFKNSSGPLSEQFKIAKEATTGQLDTYKSKTPENAQPLSERIAESLDKLQQLADKLPKTNKSKQIILDQVHEAKAEFDGNFFMSAARKLDAVVNAANENLSKKGMKEIKELCISLRGNLADRDNEFDAEKTAKEQEKNSAKDDKGEVADSDTSEFSDTESLEEDSLDNDKKETKEKKNAGIENGKEDKLNKEEKKADTIDPKEEESANNSKKDDLDTHGQKAKGRMLKDAIRGEQSRNQQQREKQRQSRKDQVESKRAANDETIPQPPPRPPAASVLQINPLPNKGAQRAERSPSHLNPSYKDPIKQFLSDKGWSIPETSDDISKTKPFEVTNGEEKFTVGINKFTTNSSSVETFKTMLETFKEAHKSDGITPQVQTDNSELAQKWQQAYKAVYGNNAPYMKVSIKTANDPKFSQEQEAEMPKPR